MLSKLINKYLHVLILSGAAFCSGLTVAEARYELHFAPSLALVELPDQFQRGLGANLNLKRYSPFAKNQEIFVAADFDVLQHGRVKNTDIRHINDKFDHRFATLGLGWSVRHPTFSSELNGRSLISANFGLGFTKIDRRETSSDLYIEKHAEDISGRVFSIAASHHISTPTGTDFWVGFTQFWYSADLNSMTGQSSGDTVSEGFKNGLSLTEQKSPFGDLPGQMKIDSSCLYLGLSMILY